MEQTRFLSPRVLIGYHQKQSQFFCLTLTFIYNMSWEGSSPFSSGARSFLHSTGMGTHLIMIRSSKVEIILLSHSHFHYWDDNHSHFLLEYEGSHCHYIYINNCFVPFFTSVDPNLKLSLDSNFWRTCWQIAHKHIKVVCSLPSRTNRWCQI